jgi:FkbM family methyltransferase
LTVAPRQVTALLGPIARSKAQLRRDIFVLAELEQKKNGVFVEFGATDGLNLSNTWLLEKEYGWSGILAEPAQCWQAALHENRSSAIESKCVWKSSGDVLEFSETEMPELSTLNPYVASDMHSETRKNARHYLVETISLADLLEKYRAPREIDYLSIDTEGSEFDILEHFDFDKYHFKVITCEHNFASTRERLHDLFQADGYRRKFEELSQWDDWYVRSQD